MTKPDELDNLKFAYALSEERIRQLESEMERLQDIIIKLSGDNAVLKNKVSK